MTKFKNSNNNLNEKVDCKKIINQLELFQSGCKSERVINAIDELLDLLDTDC